MNLDMSIFTSLSSEKCAELFFSVGVIITDEAKADLQGRASLITETSSMYIYTPSCPSPHLAFDALEKSLSDIGYRLLVSSGIDIPVYVDAPKRISRIELARHVLVRTGDQPLNKTASRGMWSDTTSILLGAAANPEMCTKCGVNGTPFLALGYGWRNCQGVPFLLSDGKSTVFVIDGIDPDAKVDIYLPICCH